MPYRIWPLRTPGASIQQHTRETMMFNERLRGIGALLAMTLLLSATAQASAPQQKTQAPGYYRMMLGDSEITALSDGIFPMKVGELMTNITPTKLDAALSRAYLK